MPLYDDVIPAQDLLLLDSDWHAVQDRRLNITPRNVFASCLINGSPTRYPVYDLTVDNASNLTNARQGMLYHIGTSEGAFDIGYGVLRKTPPNNTTLPIDFKSLGDPSTPAAVGNVFNPIVDNLFVTIYKLYPPFTELSRIASNVIYKRGDLAFTNQTATLPPVANVGKWQAGKINSSGVLRVTLSAARSFDWYNGSLAYSWDIDGGALASGYNLTDQIIEVDYEPGFFVPACTVTGTGGKTHTARLYVWANDDSDEYAAFSDRHICQLGGIKSGRQGSEFRFTVKGATHQTELFPGAGVLYQETALYNGDSLSDPDIGFDTFIGYVTDGADVNNTPGVRTRGYVAKSPLLLELPNPRQYLVEDATPVNWTEISSNNAASAVDYLLRWHASNVLMMHDFIVQSGVTARRKKSFVFEQTGLLEQLNGIAQLMVGNIGSSVEGATLLSLHPAYLLTSERDATPIKIRLDSGRYQSPVNWKQNFNMGVGLLDGLSFAYGGGNLISPYGGRAPGRIQSQSGRESKMPTFIIPRDSNALPRTLRIVGTQFAYENATYKSLTLALDRNLDVFEPADLRTFTEIELEEFVTSSGGVIRALPVNVTRRYTQRNGLIIKAIDVDFEPLAIGQSAVPLDLSRGGAGLFILDGWTIQDPTLYDEPIPDFGEVSSYALAWNESGMLACTNTLLNEVVYWIPCYTNLTGKVRAVEWSGDSNEVFVVTVDELGFIKVFNQSSIASKPGAATSWNLLQTVGAAGGGFSDYVALAVDPANPDIAGVLWYETNAVKLAYTDDGWATYSSADIGGDPQDSNSAAYRPALVCKGGKFYLWANEAGLTEVTFDSGGYGDYENVSTLTYISTSSITSGGNGGNCFRGQTGGAANGSKCAVRIHLPAAMNITNIIFSYYRSSTLGNLSVGYQVQGETAQLITPTNDATWHIVDADADIGAWSPPYNASYVDVYFVHNNTTGSNFDLRLDNIMIEVDGGGEATPTSYYLYSVNDGAGGVIGSQPAATNEPGRVMVINGTALLTSLGGVLYRITSFETVPTWVDETPESGYLVHAHPGALAADPDDTTNLYLLADNTTRKLYKSDDGGDNHTALAINFNYEGVRRYGAGGLLFGYNALDITENDGVSVHTRLGNWLTVLGAVGTIEGVRIDNDNP